MKILFDHNLPFQLAHGGFQTQIEQTKVALERVGVAVEYLRWWDVTQTGELIHFFGRPSQLYIQLAHGRGMKVVMLELLTGLGSRSASARFLQRTLIRSIRTVLPAGIVERMSWESYRLADALVALTPWEAQLMCEMFDAPAEKIHVIANGVEEIFLESRPTLRGPWLVCTATITERKRVFELAEAAIAASTPVWIIGKPYVEGDAYSGRVLALAKANPHLIRYEGQVSDRARLARIYREARGFVLLSTMETLSLSAFEAAACECPLLLSDLPWARSTFGAQATYCPRTSTAETANLLKSFYDAAPNLPVPAKPKSWVQIASELRLVYQRLLEN